MGRPFSFVVGFRRGDVQGGLAPALHFCRQPLIRWRHEPPPRHGHHRRPHPAVAHRRLCARCAAGDADRCRHGRRCLPDCPAPAQSVPRAVCRRRLCGGLRADVQPPGGRRWWPAGWGPRLCGGCAGGAAALPDAVHRGDGGSGGTGGVDAYRRLPRCQCRQILAHRAFHPAYVPLSDADQPDVAAGRPAQFGRALCGERRGADPAQSGADCRHVVVRRVTKCRGGAHPGAVRHAGRHCATGLADVVVRARRPVVAAALAAPHGPGAPIAQADRAGGAGGRGGADQPAGLHRAGGALPGRRRGELALLCRSPEPVAAGDHRHRGRHRLAARHVAAAGRRR